MPDGPLLDSRPTLQALIDRIDGQEQDSRRPAHWTYFFTEITMTETCVHLENLFTQAVALGCSVAEVSHGWSDAHLVVHLAPGMPDALRALAPTASTPVRYYLSPRTPHNQADEGFYCASCKVGLSFPQPMPNSSFKAGGGDAT